MSEQSGWDSTQPTLRPDTPVEELAALLEAAGVEYALIGGHAVNAWSVPRFTNDVDFFTEPSAEGLARFEAAASAAGYLCERRQDDGGSSGPDFVRMVHPEGRAFDIQAAKTDYQMLVIERAIPADAFNVPVATPEDLLILKLIANRSKDRGDLLNLIHREGLDWDYLQHWVSIWDVQHRLEAIREYSQKYQ